MLLPKIMREVRSIRLTNSSIIQSSVDKADVLRQLQKRTQFKEEKHYCDCV